MAACFALNALSFLVVIYALMSLHVKHIPPTGTTQACATSCRAACRYVRHHGSLVALIVLAAATTFLGFAVLTFLPLFTQQVFHEGASTYSHLLAFSGAGSVVGALVVAWLGKFKRMGLTALLVQAVYGLLIVAFAMSRVLWLSDILLFLTGAALMVRLLDRHVADPADRAQRDARPRDEHLHGRVPRRHAARQPGQRLPRHLDRRADGHRASTASCWSSSPAISS